MNKLLTTTYLIVSLCLPVSVFAADHATINVNGTGEISAVPDQATLNVTVEETADTVIAAKKTVDQRMAELLAVADKFGIDQKHRDASSIIVLPSYEYKSGERHYLGEKVTRQLTLKVTQLERLSDLLQALTQAAPMRFDAPQLGFKELPALQHKALALAVRDAREKAKTLADAAGVRIDSVLTISENGMGDGGMVYDRMKTLNAMEESAPLEFGPQIIKQQVSMTFAIDD